MRWDGIRQSAAAVTQYKPDGTAFGLTIQGIRKFASVFPARLFSRIPIAPAPPTTDSQEKIRNAGNQEDHFADRLLPSCFPAFLNRILGDHKRPRQRQRTCLSG